MKALILSLALLTFTALACEEKPTRYIFKGKSHPQKERVCLSPKLDKANSEECLHLVAPQCWFSKINKKIKIENFISPQGSPGFNLCHYLGGSPQIYEIEIKDKVWRSYSRCFAPDKKQFVDLSTLILHYK